VFKTGTIYLNFFLQVYFIGLKYCFQQFFYVNIYYLTNEFFLLKYVLLNKICLRILSDSDPNPNSLIGFGSLKTFGSFRIRIWIRIRIRIPNIAKIIAKPHPNLCTSKFKHCKKCGKNVLHFCFQLLLMA